MVAIIKTLSLGAQRRKSAFASLCFMKWKMLVLRYGVACLVPQWLNVDLLLQRWAEELLPSAAEV